MELLKERIRKDGVVKEGNVLKVDADGAADWAAAFLGLAP